ncbi:GM20981 [Drosophila sechellia]|uniref:GM20981 n=1 Tax=Drosophila sechellia TaxID=7238 RepID=B4HR74_DROSE|nr:GM20981 [Drosophila sechellia]
MWKLDSKEGIICSRAASICLAIAHLIIFANLKDHQQRSPHRRSHQGGPYSQFNFQISIHILSSQERHKLFVPWMITTAMFLYLMGYLSIVLRRHVFRIANDRYMCTGAN